jgi:CheY-like chemotaxis protein
VEDEPAAVRLMRERFQQSRKPKDLNVVGDGQEALAFLRQEGQYTGASRPDLILLDLPLPDRNGFEVLAELNPSMLGRSSPCSSACTVPESTRALASAWPSARRSSSATAGASGSSPSLGKAPPFTSPSRVTAGSAGGRALPRGQSHLAFTALGRFFAGKMETLCT